MCPQLAGEGTQVEQTETPLNWPTRAESAGSSVSGTQLTQTQKASWRHVAKVRADNLDVKIRALHPANPVSLHGVDQRSPTS
jgi:hypothetical protein